MTLLEAIDVRRSRRKYDTTPVDAEIIGKLEALAREYCAAAGIRMEFVWNDGGAFNGLRKSYGMFSGVRNYAGLITQKDDFMTIEKLGYYGELIALHAVALGLSTCWVGGSFSRKLCPFKLSDGEIIICTVTLGYAAEQDSGKEKFIRKMTHRKTKTADEMMKSDASTPDWFMNGMRAVQKAPSAVNRQPVMFSYCDDKVTAEIQKPADIGALLDMGIAKLHFELGAGNGKWNFGNGAEFIR
jgi:nitroreductase